MSAVDAVAATGSATVRYPLPQQGAGSPGYAAAAAGTSPSPARGVPGDERTPRTGAPAPDSAVGPGAAAKRQAPAVPAPSVEMKVQHRTDGAEAVVLVDRLSGKEIFALPPEQVSRAVDAALQRRRLGLHAATADASGAPLAPAGSDSTAAAEPAARTRGARRGDH